jgi:hypothetical protein
MSARSSSWAIATTLILAGTSQSGVIITTESMPAINMPGFTTYTLTATSDVPGELFAAVDFVRDGSNDPAKGRGFFGHMYYVPPPYGGILTPTGPIGVPPLGYVQNDSYFLVRSTEIVVPAGLAEEGSNFLQAAWAWRQPIGQSFELAQIVIPDNAIVTYRGVFTVNRNGTYLDLPAVSGTIGAPEPASVLLVGWAISGLLCRFRSLAAWK